MDTRNFKSAAAGAAGGWSQTFGAGAHSGPPHGLAGADRIAVVAPSPRVLSMALQRAVGMAEGLRVRHVDVLSARLARPAGLADLAPPPGGRAVFHEITPPDWRLHRTQPPSLVITHQEAHCASLGVFDSACAAWLGRTGACRPMPLVLGWNERHVRQGPANVARARFLARYGGAPVLLVRQTPVRPCRHVLYPTDFSEPSLAGLRVALAALPQARFTLLYPARVSGEGHMRTTGVSGGSIDACRRVLETRARLCFSSVRASAATDAGRLSLAISRESLVHAVARYAAMVRIDVIAVSGPPRGMVDNWLWKASVCGMLAGTSCDLLLAAGR